MKQPTSVGGLGLTDIKLQAQALKIAWVKRILNDQNQGLKILAKQTLSYPENYIWTANLRKEDVSKISLNDNFWTDVLQAWCQFNLRNH